MCETCCRCLVMDWLNPLVCRMLPGTRTSWSSKQATKEFNKPSQRFHEQR